MCHKENFVGKIFQKYNACKKDLVSENCHDNMSHVLRYIFFKCILEYTFVCFTVLVYMFLFNAQCLYSTLIQLL